MSQKSELSIDREAGTGRIEYRDILASRGRASELDSVLEILDGKERFDQRLEGIRFTMSILSSKKGELAVDIFFEYEDEKAVQEAFGLEKDEDGSLVFRSSERDSIFSSNGEGEGKERRWSPEAEKLRLELTGEPLEEEERRDMVLVKYVER